MKPLVRVSLLSGCIFGAVVGVAVALSLDFMMAGVAGGGWYESVKHDIALTFGGEWASTDWIVYSGVGIVIGGIGVMGAAMGAVFGAAAGKILDKLTY